MVEHRAVHGASLGQLEAALRDSAALGNISSAAAEHLIGMLPDKSVSFEVIMTLLDMAKHGLRLDSLKSGAATTTVAEVPSGPVPDVRSFFESFVLPSRPAVVRGLAAAHRFPPSARFADFGYLRRLSGRRQVTVRAKSFDDQAGRRHFPTVAECPLPFSRFLDAIEQSERHDSKMPFYLGGVALASALPELSEAVAAEAWSPGQHFSSCFGLRIGSQRDARPLRHV